MNIETLRNYCLAKPGTTESFPFDETTLVFKVMGKMFALTDLVENRSVNLKCDPELAIQLRERYDAVQPGFHMSKSLWNTVNYDGIPDDQLIFEWIDHSYEQVVKGLPKKIRNQLAEMS